MRPSSGARWYTKAYKGHRETRNALRVRQHGLCYWCEAPMIAYNTKGIPHNHPWRETVEHLRPTSLGGCNHFQNKALVHSYCNQLRGNMWDGTQFCVRFECWWSWMMDNFIRIV